MHFRLTYRPATASLALILALCLLYYENISAVAVEWSGSGPYSHGILGLAIAAYIFWHDRHLIRPNITRFGILAFVPGLILGLAWALAHAVNIQLLEMLSLYGVFVCCFISLFGWMNTIRLWVGFLSIFLILPVWNLLQIPLQVISSDVTEVVLRTLNIPTLREGFNFTVPGGRFIVEEACSGLGFLLTSCLLSLVYIHFNRISTQNGIILFCFALAMSLFSNWVRIVTIMIVGNATQMQHAIVQDHLTFGWILFSIMLIPVLYFAQFLRREEAEKHASDESGSYRMHIAPTMVAVLLLTNPFLISMALANPRTANLTTDEVEIFEKHFKPARNQTGVNWAPVYPGAKVIKTQKLLTDENFSFLGLVIFYDQQKQGEELIFVNNKLFDNKKWSVINERQIRKDGAVAQHISLKSGNLSRELIYWYLVGERITTSKLGTKLAEIEGVLKKNRHAYIFALAADHTSLSHNTTLNKLIPIASTLQKQLGKHKL